LGICEVLIPLTNSPSVEVQGNSAAALGNLSSKGECDNLLPAMMLIPDTRSGRGLCTFQRSVE
jgi:vacuolar protein 8